MTIDVRPIEPRWYEEKSAVQSRTWRELNQGKISQEIVDAIAPEFALRLTQRHASDPGQAPCWWRWTTVM